MGHTLNYYCDLCQDPAEQEELAQLVIGGEYEGEVCEKCLHQVWARAKPAIEGESLLRTVV